MFEIFEHTADLGIRVRAASLPELFRDAARGLFSVLVANTDRVRPVREKVFRLTSDDREYLLVDWLSELLYTFETERLVFTEFEISLRDLSLQATCRGEELDVERHGCGNEIKAITYHGLSVQPLRDAWQAEVIVDI